MESAYFLFIPVGCDSAVYVAQEEWIVTAMAYLLLNIFLTTCLVLDLGLLHRHFGVLIWSDKSVLSPLSPNICGTVY